MISLSVAALAAILGGAPQTVLLDFHADWCGPCRQMDPLIDALAERGFPVRRVNVDHESELAQRFQVQGVPCFVMLRDGEEVDRVVGATTQARLERMFRQAAGHSTSAPAGGLDKLRSTAHVPRSRIGRGQSPDGSMVPVVMPSSPSAQPLGDGPPQVASLGGTRSPRALPASPNASGGTALGQAPAWQGPVTPPAPTGPPAGGGFDRTANPAGPPLGASSPFAKPPSPAAGVIERLMAASVRIRVGDSGGRSVGSGTIIDVRQGEALVVTCGHIFRDYQGGGAIEVDLFEPGAQRTVQGRLISHDLDSDVGLLIVRANGHVTPARLPARDHALSIGATVFNIGCNHGEDPTARQSQITSIDKFVRPPNLTVAGQPVQGRSGGGLFTTDGLTIGVCNAADPSDNDGLYAALGSIYAELDRAGIRPAIAPPAETADVILAAQSSPPALPQRIPLRAGGGQSAPPLDPFSIPAAHTPAASSATPPASFASGLAPQKGTGSEPMYRAQGGTVGREVPVPLLRDAPGNPSQTRSGSEPMYRAQGGIVGRDVPGPPFRDAPDNPAGLTPREEAALAEIQSAAGRAEVICVIRPLDDPEAKTQVIMLDRASPALLAQLTAGSRTATQPQTPSNAAMSSAPQAGHVADAAPQATSFDLPQRTPLPPAVQAPLEVSIHENGAAGDDLQPPHDSTSRNRRARSTFGARRRAMSAAPRALPVR